MEIIRRLFSFWSHHTIAGTLCRLEAQAKAAILCLCGAFPAPLLWWSGPLSLPPRTTLLLIYRIQSHTHPKRRKFCLKHAGRKSVKEELPERRKGPKRAIECRLKVPTHVWEQSHEGSNLSPMPSPLLLVQPFPWLRILGKYSTYMTGLKEHPRKIKSDFIFLGCFFEVDLSWPRAFD